nr:MAG TPA: hypothetical protein [Caudoviricetes sp.]
MLSSVRAFLFFNRYLLAIRKHESKFPSAEFGHGSQVTTRPAIPCHFVAQYLLACSDILSKFDLLLSA